MTEYSYWYFRWRDGGELEWFLFPALALTRFEDGSFNACVHWLKWETGYYRDASEYDE